MRKFPRQGTRGHRWGSERRRRAWWATFLQRRRRKRAAADAALEPAILLDSDGHGHLTWTLNFTTEYDGLNCYWSADGVNWPDPAFDGAPIAAGAWDCSGIEGYLRICVCDWDGGDIPPYSNAVYSDGL